MSRESIHHVITMVLADNQVPQPQLVATRITEALIALGLGPKEWSE